MSIGAALGSHLKAHVPTAGERVYPGVLPGPQAVLPALTYQRISTPTTKHRSSQAPTYSRPRYQIDGWAETLLEAEQLRSEIYAAMGTLAALSVTPRIDVALMADDRDIREADPGRWRASIDYHISHVEE